MQRLILPVLALVLAATAPTAALAQADAQQAFQQAKAALAGGEFAKARDLAITASETDPRNPEVFLLLGKAHYQLGELSEAVAAWKRNLALAPEEPFAKQMLDVLKGQTAEVDVRVGLIEAMIHERLFPSAMRLWKELLDDEARRQPEDANDSHGVRRERLEHVNDDVREDDLVDHRVRHIAAPRSETARISGVVFRY